MSHKLGYVEELTIIGENPFKTIVSLCWHCGKLEMHPLPDPVKDAPIGSLIYYDESGTFHWTSKASDSGLNDMFGVIK